MLEKLFFNRNNMFKPEINYFEVKFVYLDLKFISTKNDSLTLCNAFKPEIFKFYWQWFISTKKMLLLMQT